MPDSRLQITNHRIAQVIAVEPWHDAYDAFEAAAQLAAEALEAAAELERMPGWTEGSLNPAFKFWQEVRALNLAAARALAGANQTLAEALTVYVLLKSLSTSNPLSAHPARLGREEEE